MLSHDIRTQVFGQYVRWIDLTVNLTDCELFLPDFVLDPKESSVQVANSSHSSSLSHAHRCGCIREDCNPRSCTQILLQTSDSQTFARPSDQANQFSFSTGQGDAHLGSRPVLEDVRTSKNQSTSGGLPRSRAAGPVAVCHHGDLAGVVLPIKPVYQTRSSLKVATQSL